MRSAGAALLTAALAFPSCKQQAPRPRGTTAPAAVAAVDAPPAHCMELRRRLCAQFGASSEVCAMAKDKTEQFSAEGCLRMLSHYESSASAALAYVEAKRALQGREQLTPHGPAPTVGSAAAPLTLVLFSDFTDPECGRAAGIATSLENLFASQARLVFRQFPSRQCPDAHLAAEASLAAHAQGKFWAFHDVMFGNPQAHDRAALERHARAAGLDLRRFKQALDQHTYAADVEADVELGRKLGIGGVPALFANGKSVRVPYGVDELARIIHEGMATKP
jgi:protein-disulfide isomerase